MYLGLQQDRVWGTIKTALLSVFNTEPSLWVKMYRQPSFTANVDSLCGLSRKELNLKHEWRSAWNQQARPGLCQ